MSLGLGLALGSLLAVASFLLTGRDPTVALSLFLVLVLVLVTATIGGILIPVLLEKVGIDPRRTRLERDLHDPSAMEPVPCRNPGCACPGTGTSEYCSASCASAANGLIAPAGCACGHPKCSPFPELAELEKAEGSD